MTYVPKHLDQTKDASRGELKPLPALLRILRTVAIIGAFYFGLGLAADEVAKRVPPSWEAHLAWEPDGVLESPKLERAQQLLDRLLAGASMRPLPYHLILIETEDTNAFALPGGVIAITEGLLDGVESEQGLAMVIGHELGHHHRRHVLRKLGRALLLVVPFAALTGEVSGIAHHLLNLVESKYSRDQEREADSIGLRLVQQSFGDTEGALEFFELILAENGEGGRWAALGSSHPATAERLEGLRAEARILRDASRSVRN